MDQLIFAIENEKNNRFNKIWTKLDKGSKLNRISKYIENETNKNNLNDEEKQLLHKLLIYLCENGSLNKIGDVHYCNEKLQILNIKNLKYDEQNKKYSFNLPKKTIKPTSKSKSNIDRHFSRSKENKNK